MLESDRSIIQRSPVFAFADPGQYRTLSPASDSLQLNGVLNRKVTDTVSATVNASWQRDTSRALLGLDSATLASVTRPLVLQALGRDVTTDALHGGITLNGNMAKWTWTLTGNYDLSISRTLTDRDVSPVIRGGDTARTQTDTSNGIYTLSGPILDLPAGAVRTTLKAGFATTRLSSQSVRGGVAQSGNLARDEANGRINFDVPLANPDRDVAGAIGKLSINGNLAYRHLSDFGNLVSFGYGLNWQPVSGLTFLASAIGSENEPGIADLGNPTIVTPNVSTYDFTRGETVLIDRISGGNRALLTEVQRDTKMSVNYQPRMLKGLTVGVDYFRNRSTNPVDAFPVLTPEIEAAFPGRVTRDATGRLVSIDSRSINYAATRSDVVRVGFTFQKEFGMPAGGRGAMGSPPPGRGKPGRPAGGFGRGGDGGRWSVALYDSIRLMDQIVIRDGLPVLDLLGGSATGSSGGSARHSFDLDTGWFNKGLGVRLKGSYSSGSLVNGSTPASTLRFGDLATLNFEAFFNFDSRASLIEAMPLLKGSRLRFSVNNIFNEIRDVRDGTGAVPLSYQPGYLDPRGRSWKIDFKKTF